MVSKKAHLGQRTSPMKDSRNHPESPSVRDSDRMLPAGDKSRRAEKGEEPT
jgi:hypothetical protein